LVEKGYGPNLNFHYSFETTKPPMRLILEDNSIRLECRESDIAKFKERSEVEESVIFGGSFGDKFIYALRTSHSYESLHVTLIANELRIFVPKSLAYDWYNGDIQGFGEMIDIGEGRELLLRVDRMVEEAPMQGPQSDDIKSMEG